MNFNVAIDGPSAAGKSTISKAIADKYQLINLDTGAMYRCVAYLVNNSDVDEKNETAVYNLIKDMKIDFKTDGTLLLNNEDVTSKIRNDEISMLASTLSKFQSVRSFLVSMQQEIAKNKGYILDGRDIGTVVLPDAEVKIFLVADVEERALRRHKEYVNNGLEVSFEDIKSDIEARDYQDTHREHSPLKQAEDAIKVDTSTMSIDEVIEKISTIIDSKVGDIL